ncbi:hypothetical protein FACS1894109_15570 [Spirochaetia bacterium]|nr:hypothetical protein FACS1894109_15570 [Spirochaetia bacterium]
MKLYGLDIETNDPHLTDKGASWVYGEGSIIVVGLYNAQTGAKRALDGNGGETVKKLLLDKNVILVGANIVYDMGWLCYEHGLKAKEIACQLIDVSIAESMIDEYQAYSLDALAFKYLQERKGADALKAICEGLGYKGDFRKHLLKLWEAGYKKEIRDYVISDADQPVRVWEVQKDILEKTGSMDAATINFKLIRIVLGMKQRGTRISMEKRKENAATLQAVQDRLLPDFEKQHGKINFNSPKQLAELFRRENVPFKHRITIKGWEGEPKFTGSEVWDMRKKLKDVFNGIRVEKGKLLIYLPYQYAARTADQLVKMGFSVTNNPSLAKKQLEMVRKSHELVQWVLDLKALQFHLDNFFGPNFEQFIVKHGKNDYRIHPDFNIVGARQTGRFSSSDPNGQNIPARSVLFEGTEREIKIYKLCRECFLPDRGMWMGKMDFAGQENRLMAHFAVGDKGDFIREQYNKNPDFDEHDLVGEESGLYEEHGKKIGRKFIKNYRFGKAYGMQITTMMGYFGWTKEHAEHMDHVFSETAPWVKDTMDKVSDVIVKRGFIRTVAGRRCHLERFGGKVNTRSAYKGFNKLIQGSGADLMKKAMVDMDEEGLTEIFPLYLSIHDEIDFGVPRTKKALKMLPKLQSVMENTYKLSVPMRVDPELGPDWGHVVAYEENKEKFEQKVAA